MAIPKKTVHGLFDVAGMRQSAPSTPGPTSTQRPSHRIGARAVGSFVPRLTKTAFEKFGFSTVALLTDWPNIVGPHLARMTRPERIKWPKSIAQERFGDVAGSAGGPRAGATVYICVEPARALDVQYQASLILERINGYFGYKAVAELRLTQACLAAPQPAAEPAAAKRGSVTPEPALAAVTDEGLRRAFERMQAGIAARRR